VIRLVENAVPIKCKHGVEHEALIIAKRNADGKWNGKGSRGWKADASDKDQDRMGKATCFYFHKEDHLVWNCPSMKCGNPPVTNESTEAPAKAKDDSIITT
jgi:hypothetical protein